MSIHHVNRVAGLHGVKIFMPFGIVWFYPLAPQALGACQRLAPRWDSRSGRWGYSGVALLETLFSLSPVALALPSHDVNPLVLDCLPCLCV